MDFTKREILVQGVRLGSSLVALLICSCSFSGERSDIAKLQELHGLKPNGTRDLKSQGTRERVEVAANLLRRKKFLTRKEFVSICRFGSDSINLSIGAPHEGRVGINESWVIEGGATVKASGYSAHDGEISPELIDRIISKKILDDFKILKIWIFDKSGKLTSITVGSQ